MKGETILSRAGITSLILVGFVFVLPTTIGYLANRNDRRLSPSYRFDIGIVSISRFIGWHHNPLSIRAAEKIEVVRDDLVEITVEKSPEISKEDLNALVELYLTHHYRYRWRENYFGTHYRIAVSKESEIQCRAFLNRLKRGDTIDVEHENALYWKRLQWAEYQSAPKPVAEQHYGTVPLSTPDL